MGCAADGRQVLDAIVECVPVDVMHDISDMQWPIRIFPNGYCSHTPDVRLCDLDPCTMNATVDTNPHRSDDGMIRWLATDHELCRTGSTYALGGRLQISSATSSASIGTIVHR